MKISLRIACIAITCLTFHLPTNAQTVKDVMEKHIAAIGGQKVIDKMRTMKIVQTFVSSDRKSDNTGEPALLSIQMVSKDIAFRTISIRKNDYSSTIETKKKGWQILADKKMYTCLESPGMLNEFKEMMEPAGVLYHYYQHGVLKYDGETRLPSDSSIHAYLLKMELHQDLHQYFFIDTENGQLRCMMQQFSNGQKAYWYYENFRKASNGFMYPSRFGHKNQAGETSWYKLNYYPNIPFSKKVFTPPPYSLKKQTAPAILKALQKEKY